jgi:FkbM family methyltransferase
LSNILKKAICRLLSVGGYEIRKKGSYSLNGYAVDELSGIPYKDFLSLYFKSRNLSDFFFIQIGAHNGVSNAFDFLHEFVSHMKLRGLLVEPQAEVFQELKENYRRCETVHFENAAIAKDTGMKQLYTVKKAIDFLQYASQAASFDSAHVARILKRHLRKEASVDVRKKFKALGLRVDDCIGAESVQAHTFQSLLEKHGIWKYDLLQIDTEGFDYEVIKMAQLDRYRPTLLNYEHEYMSEKEKRECWSYLISLNYHLFRHGVDTTAYLPESFAERRESLARVATAGSS